MTLNKLSEGDIVLLNLDPTLGAEKNKTRPCLVLENGNHSKLPLIIVVPITDAAGKEKKRIFVSIPHPSNTGLSKKSVIDPYQIRSVSKTRVLKKLGYVDSPVLDQVKSRIALILDIGNEHIT